MKAKLFAFVLVLGIIFSFGKPSIIFAKTNGKSDISVKEALSSVVNNYSKIQDQTATIETTSKIGNQPQSDTEISQIKIKAPDKTKIISPEVIIIENDEKISITETSKEPIIFDSSTYAPATSSAQMNYFYHTEEFLDKHTVTIIEHKGNIFIIEAEAKEPELYSKMRIKIDSTLGIELSCEIYDIDGELATKTETLDYKHIGDVNIPTKTKETIYLEQGTIVKIYTYTNLQLNTGISDAEFEIKEEGERP